MMLNQRLFACGGHRCSMLNADNFYQLKVENQCAEWRYGSTIWATTIGIGAALSTTVGGQLIQHFGFNASFLGLAAIAAFALVLLCFGVPETLTGDDTGTAPQAAVKGATPSDTEVFA